MRISSTLFFQTGLNSINTQQADLMHLYQKIGSGQRMVTPADDPLAAAQAINLSQSQSLNQRFAENREVAKRNLGESENTLNSVTLLLQDVKTRLIEAGNGTLSDTDRATLAGVLKDARTNMLNLANAKDGSGQYLFSGAKGNVAPYQEVNGIVSYSGDAGQRRVQADATRQIPTSDVGSDIFERAAPGTLQYLTRAEFSSVAGSPNQGTATIGGPMVTDPSGANVGKTFKIQFTSPTEYQITATDALGNAALLEESAGDTSFSYDPNSSSLINIPGGVQVKFQGAPATGDTFYVEPATVPDYVATAAAGNSAGVSAGSVLVSDYSVVQPDYTYEVKFTAADKYTLTVSDGSGTQVSQETGLDFIPGRENTLELPPGLQVKISGTPANNDTFTVSATDPAAKTDLNIFTALDDIIGRLESSTASNPKELADLRNAMAGAMQRVDLTYNNVLTVRSSVGARLNELESLDANGQQRSLGYTKELSRLEDLDYYTATTQLQLRTSALEAAALAFRKIQSTSLFNMGSSN
jgi:flagellar hook-associated protein 3 FlgL